MDYNILAALTQRVGNSDNSLEFSNEEIYNYLGNVFIISYLPKGRIVYGKDFSCLFLTHRYY